MSVIVDPVLAIGDERRLLKGAPFRAILTDQDEPFIKYEVVDVIHDATSVLPDKCLYIRSCLCHPLLAGGCDGTSDLGT